MKTCPNCFGRGGFGDAEMEIECDHCGGTGQVPDAAYTCNDCTDNKTCKYAWDLYNTDGDCLASK